MLIPVMLIGLFVVIVATLMLVGWRHRPGLEIPARPWPPVIEMPPKDRRLRIRLLVFGLASYVVGAVGYLSLHSAGFSTAANVVGGVALLVYFGALVARIALTVRFALQTRRTLRSQQRGSG